MLGDARTEHVARWARHFRSRGDTVWVASAEDAPGVDVRLSLPVRWAFAAYPLLVPVLKRVIQKLQPDIIVAHYLPNYGLLAALSGFRPHVIVAWGSDLLVLPGRNALQRARTRLVATRGQAFLVDAQMLVEPLVRFGAPVERVFVCPFGVDDDVVAVGQRVQRSPSDTPVVLCNRRHEKQYANDVVLQAVGLLRAQGKNVSLVMANHGSLTGALTKEAASLGLAERVSWPGYLCRGRYLESLATANLYVSAAPSDSTSVSLLEAMAAGLAGIVPDNAGNREWIEHNRSGLLFPPGDANALAACISSLIDDPARAVAMSVRARGVINERGKWSATIRRAELLFDQLVSAR